MSCLRTAYEERIRRLKDGIEAWLKSDVAEEAGAPQSWSSEAMPEAVRAVAGRYNKICSGLDGTLVAGFDQPLVMTGDLDGDAIQDFVLNPQNMQCNAAATAFCGNGGCQILLALSGGGYREPVEILGGAPALRQNEEHGTFLDVWVDRANCDAAHEQGACLAHYAWNDGKLSATYEARKSEE